MSMQNTSAYGAYGYQHRQILVGRSAEAEAFATAARMLNEARQSPEDRRAALDVLRYNLNLWTGVQAALDTSESELSDDLINKLLALSVFIDRRTAEAIADPRPELLDALIDINRAIAQGQLLNS